MQYIYRTIATIDYKVHAVLEETECSCHSPRHADIHFYDPAWSWLTLFWHWLVHQGGPVVRAQTQVQHDKQETRKSLPQDGQIGRKWKLISSHLNRYQWKLSYTNLKTIPCDVVSYVRYFMLILHSLKCSSISVIISGKRQWRLLICSILSPCILWSSWCS